MRLASTFCSAIVLSLILRNPFYYPSPSNSFSQFLRARDHFLFFTSLWVQGHGLPVISFVFPLLRLLRSLSSFVLLPLTLRLCTFPFCSDGMFYFALAISCTCEIVACSYNNQYLDALILISTASAQPFWLGVVMLVHAAAFYYTASSLVVTVYFRTIHHRKAASAHPPTVGHTHATLTLNSNVVNLDLEIKKENLTFPVYRNYLRDCLRLGKSGHHRR